MGRTAGRRRIKNHDIVSVAGELVGRSEANDAGANHANTPSTHDAIVGRCEVIDGPRYN